MFGHPAHHLIATVALVVAVAALFAPDKRRRIMVALAVVLLAVAHMLMP